MHPFDLLESLSDKSTFVLFDLAVLHIYLVNHPCPNHELVIRTSHLAFLPPNFSSLFHLQRAHRLLTVFYSQSTFDRTLATLHDRAKQNFMDDLRSFREECLAVGYLGAFLAAQLDLTTAAGEEYITLTVSYVPKGSSDVTRVALATRAFPGTHTAEGIRPWIEAARRFFCRFTVFSCLIFCILNCIVSACSGG